MPGSRNLSHHFDKKPVKMVLEFFWSWLWIRPIPSSSKLKRNSDKDDEISLISWGIKTSSSSSVKKTRENNQCNRTNNPSCFSWFRQRKKSRAKIKIVAKSDQTTTYLYETKSGSKRRSEVIPDFWGETADPFQSFR